MSTATQTVRIFGPNLSHAGQSKGTFHVHDIGCADCAHYGRGKKYGGEDAGWTITAGSQQAVVEEVYSDMIEPDDDWRDLDDLYFAPCVKVPREEPAAETIEEVPAASPEHEAAIAAANARDLGADGAAALDAAERREEARRLVGAITRAINEVERLEAQGGPKRLQWAAQERTHARLWALRLADLLER